MIPDAEQRGHPHQLSHVPVEGHGVADTEDSQLATAFVRAELERRDCLTCDGLGHCDPCPTCGGSGEEPAA